MMPAVVPFRAGVEIGHGVHSAMVVTWGFEEIVPEVIKAYRAQVHSPRRHSLNRLGAPPPRCPAQS